MDSKRPTSAPAAPAEDRGLALDEISSGFAELLAKGQDPYAPAADSQPAADSPPSRSAAATGRDRGDHAAQHSGGDALCGASARRAAHERASRWVDARPSPWPKWTSWYAS